MSNRIPGRRMLPGRIFLGSLLSLAALATAAEPAPRAMIRSLQADNAVAELPLSAGSTASADGVAWDLKVAESPVPDRPDARDFEFTFTLAQGQQEKAAACVVLDFPEWSTQNYVLIPACVYNGNRFDILDQKYPPMWRDRSQYRVDMPVTMTRNPHLNLHEGPSSIHVDTGNAATPLIAVHQQAQHRGTMLLTTQDTRLGNTGLAIEESEDRHSAKFILSAPASGKRWAAWKAGDSVTIRCRLYQFDCGDIQSLYNRFAEIRKDLNPAQRVEITPFSAVWPIMEKFYDDHRWDEEFGLYRMTDKRTGGYNYIFQLGWVGGGQIPLPMLLQGNARSQSRAIKNLETIFDKMQVPSGFFYTMYNGQRVINDGFESQHPDHLTMVRKEADWLFMSIRNFQAMEASGRPVPDQWKKQVHSLADALVTLWGKYGQFGQFIDCESGELLVGNSVAGGRVPAGLALASVYFKEPRYLEIAKASATLYRRDYLGKGILNGGPGEILSAPDSEAAFALLESFVWLYEVTGDRAWLTPAKDIVRQCASWTVSYDYHFPPNSHMGKVDARSCGVVVANVQNKHGAPGICTLSGDSLLRLARATDDPLAMDLLADISHGIVQYMSRESRLLGNMPPGSICERVNLSDWEGAGAVGKVWSSTSWCETALMLTVTEIPSLYVRKDTGTFAVFDHVQAERVSKPGEPLKLRITNPTPLAADLRILVEDAAQAATPLHAFPLKNARLQHVDAGQAIEVEFQ